MRYEALKEHHLKDIIPFYIEAFNAPPWNDQWTETTVERRLMQMIHCEGFQGMVCYEADQLVGMILGNREYYYNGIHFQVKEFCTHGEVQGKGIGTKLLEVFSKQLKASGVDEIILFTTRDEKTEGFYLKRGFKTFDEMIMMGKSI